MKRVGIIGTGLIGGSLLLALRRKGIELVAVDPGADTRARLEQAGISNVTATPDERLRDCELVVLATPLPTVLELLPKVGALLSGADAVLTDVAGAKLNVVETAARVLPKNVPFVGGHPMAGRAVGGFESALPELFEDRTVALCGDGDDPAVEKVEAMWRRAGARVVHCTAQAHDEAVARVSHLPYFTACATALVADEGDALAHQLAATGLKDTTRVATDATIRFAAQANAALPSRLREAARLLEAFADSLDDEASLDAQLDAASAARRRLYPER